MPDYGSWSLVLPLLLACAWGLFVLVVEMFATNPRFTGVAWLTLVGLGGLAWTAAVPAETGVFAGVLAADPLTSYATVMFAVFAAATVFFSVEYVPDAGIVRGEYYPVLLFAVAGLAIMAAATDLIVMFLGLETMSMAVYTLAGIQKQSLRSNEASLKYFLLGAFASAVLLYGIAMLYAVAGSTDLAGINAALQAGSFAGSDALILQLGVGLLLVGLGFKVAAVPFHLWAPDVYEGAPTSVTAFMATAVKAGGFAVMARTVLGALGPVHADIAPLLAASAAATMTVGNLIALRQTSLKRMLAYSSVAHTGYMLVGLVAGTAAGGAALLYYLAAYGAMNLAAFGVVISLSRRNRPCDAIDDLAGLGQSQPLLAVVMTLAMVSLLGMPPLAGFVGKFYIFAAALEAGYTWLVVIAVLNSVVSAYYYLGVVRAMYFEEGGLTVSEIRPHASVAVAAAAVATVVLGLAPAGLLSAATAAFADVLLGP